MSWNMIEETSHKSKTLSTPYNKQLVVGIVNWKQVVYTFVL